MWRLAGAHSVNYDDKQVPWYVIETLYDLQSGRYMALGMKNEERRAYEFGFEASASEFSSGALRQDGVR